MNGQSKETSYWSGMAARYAALAAPLRISPSEQNIYQDLTAQWQGTRPSPRVLVMGATPDFYHLPWPRNTDLLAVDRSAEMLSGVWPGQESQKLCQDWLSMQLPDQSRDIALCDGGLSFFPYPDVLQQLAKNITRIIAPGGLLIVRLYLESEQPESSADIYRELRQGRIPNSSELKLRLWFALNATDGSGVCLDDIWRNFNEEFAHHESLSRFVSWPDSEWQSMQAYQGQQDIYYFPSVKQLTAALLAADSRFTLQANLRPGGPCQQHLKIVSFRRDS